MSPPVVANNVTFQEETKDGPARTSVVQKKKKEKKKQLQSQPKSKGSSGVDNKSAVLL